MMKNSILLSFFTLAAIIFFSSPSIAATFSDGDACTVAGRLHTKNDASGAYQLICNGTTWEKIITINNGGSVEVVGEMMIGTSTGLSCAAGTEGSIRYNSTDKNIEVCDGTDWALIRASACDNAPAYLAFPSLTAQSTSTTVTSDILAVTGMDSGCTASVGVSGDGSPEYRTCSDASCSSVLQTWTAANNTLDIQGNYIQLRTTTSGSNGDAYTVTLSTGVTTHDWLVSTGVTDCGNIGSVCADGSVYAGLTGSDAMYVTRCDAGMTWNGSACDGARSTMTWNDGTSNSTITSVVDQQDGQTNTASLVTIDSNAGTAGTQVHAAAQYCNDLVLHGKSDWYLPAKNELDTLYGNKTVIGNFGSYSYWSSSEFATTTAWRLIFASGSEATGSKDADTYVLRCARRD